MSEVQSRPVAPRGRGSARGRGGFSSRGGRGGRPHPTNGTDNTAPAPIEDEGEVGQLKRQYGSKVTTIKEMFPDWTDEDIVFALQETDGDLENTVGRITDGTISQWGEVSKNKKDRSRSKAKEGAVFGDVANQARTARGGRGGFDSGRGGRGRGTDRGRAGKGRGASVAHTNGARKENVVESTPTVESNAWDTAETPAWDTSSKAVETTTEENSWDTSAGATTTAAAPAAPASSIIPDGVKKSWASIFAPAPVPKKAPEPVEKPAPEPVKPQEPVEVPSNEPEVVNPSEPVPVEPIEESPAVPTTIEEPESAITPSKDELTEDNLEQVPDTSAPAPTATAASTAASSWDPRNTATSTPYTNLQVQAQAIRPPTSGFQASALKATGSSGRTPSYQRRVLDQEEAVRMPGNREVDRAAVQFGAFNLNGTGDEDVDGDREEPETRGQPPQHSPVAPRASLPPAPVTQQPAAAPESFPTPKQSAGLPAATHPTAAPGLPSPQSLPNAQAPSQQGPQANAQFGQYGRFAQSGAQEPSSVPQKPYDAFSQQAPSTQSPFEGYPSQQSQSQPQQQPQSGAFSSAPNEYSSYYTSDQGRNAYNYYNQQQYALQHGGQGQQEVPASQRSYSGYGGPQSEASSQFPQSAAQPAQSRYATAGEGQNSGHTTPNPTAQTQQSTTSQGAQPQPGHSQQPQGQNYPYGHPYYNYPSYTSYMNQYPNYPGGNYPAGPYGAKGGLHQPYQGYGMSPGAPYDQHASSPAAAGFGASSLHGRDSAALGGALGEYGRAGSAQPSQTPQGLSGSGAFGGAAHDAFGRGSSYQGQNQQHYNATQGSQQGAGDELKPFGESKPTNGPSPSLAQAGRPGSATNAAPGSALPPPQSQQGGYGGYPAHLQQAHGLHGSQTGSQYAGLGGAGAHQAAGQGHQNSQYGGYQAFGGNYYANSQQRGWGGNYGH
ncbi:hypothetical protein HYFRA_00006766 [Hymenoscyphus fraxineus]|uniref:RNA polymerase II degradation factor 1 n=1 Tax=Hymenoscyphus fraxineus TaxID=746836 RepID=A0A9N9KMY6_9HELO|nr:hypothetical protein HYFRA_00006766 [Hymenoscyphus fraxineus]